MLKMISFRIILQELILQENYMINIVEILLELFVQYLFILYKKIKSLSWFSTVKSP